MIERESRLPQPRFKPSDKSASARLASRIGTFSSRPSAVASETSLCASRNALPQTFFLDAKHRIVDHVFGAVTAAQLAKGLSLMKSAS